MDRLQRRDILRLGAGLSALALLSACDTTGFNFGPLDDRGAGQGNGPMAAGGSFGQGPVQVALLLPLSGDPALANVGISMANAADIASTPSTSARSLRDLERDGIAAALAATGGNKAQAAALLEIDRSTLYKKLKDYGLG